MVTATIDRIGGDIVGWARDIDVSALKTTPWEREELRDWLDRPEDWDAMVWQRMDRAVRNMGDMADLGRYAKENHKRLIFASGPGGAMLELDFTSPMSELIMLILAFAAQLEGQTIMERTQGAAAYLQSLGRWPGGVVPYGWRPGRRMFADGNEGWWLYLHSHEDPTKDTATIRRGMVARAIAGRSYSEITRWLIESQAITPRDFRSMLATPPRDPDPKSTWNVTVVREMLTSPMLRGHLTKKDGALVRNVDGTPVLQGEALIDDATWYDLVDAVTRLGSGTAGQPRRRDGHPLLGVLVCGACGANMYASWYRERRGRHADPTSPMHKRATFRCNGKLHPPGVATMSIMADRTLAYVNEQFMKRLGRMRRTQTVRVAGVDHRGEIAELEEDISELTTRMVRLRGPAADAVERQIQGLSDRLEKLQETPVVPSREETVELDTTWGDDWTAAGDDWKVKLAMLKAVGARVSVGPPPKQWRAPASERLRFEIGTHVDPEEDAMADALHQATD